MVLLVVVGERENEGLYEADIKQGECVQLGRRPAVTKKKATKTDGRGRRKRNGGRQEEDDSPVVHTRNSPRRWCVGTSCQYVQSDSGTRGTGTGGEGRRELSFGLGFPTGSAKQSMTVDTPGP